MKPNISQKAIYYGLGGGLVIVLAAVGFKLLTPTAPPVQVAPNQFVNVSAIKRGVQDCATYVRVGEGIGPSAYLCVTENRDLVVRWQDFPRETATTITIYRAEAGSETLQAWQTLTVTGESGETMLRENLTVEEIAAGGGIGGTAFYIEAASPTGTLIFASAPAASSTATSTATSTPTGTATSTATSPSDDGATSTPVAPSPPPTPPPSPTPTSTTTSTLPAATSTQASATTTATSTGVIVYYYSPSGTVTGSSTITEPQSNFWVQHVNQKIELGWYSLPPDTTRMTVSRSASADGPWLALLTQNNPVTTYYQIYIVDSTAGQTRWYKLETYDGGTKTATYGPVELPPQ